VDERSFETITVKNSVKNGHCFSVVRGGVAERTASAKGQTVKEQNIAPTRRACTRVLINDSRAVGDKYCVLVVWRGSQKRVRESYIGRRKSFNAQFKPVPEREARFGLGESIQGAETRGEPRRSSAMVVEFVANKLRGGRV
jgi:hypothetical protein